MLSKMRRGFLSPKHVSFTFDYLGESNVNPAVGSHPQSVIVLIIVGTA